MGVVACNFYRHIFGSKLYFVNSGKFFFAIIFLLNAFSLKAQRETDLGLCVGLGYYMGDINPSIPFYAAKPNIGLTYRYNFNQRYIVKFEGHYIQLAANDLDFNNVFQQSRGANFSLSPLYDLSAQFEFNFLPLKFVNRKFGFSPFVSGGVGCMLRLDKMGSFSDMFVIPSAFGTRVSYSKNWSIGIAFNLRKTFTDNLDGVENLISPGMKTIINNNDWYSFANIFITYKIFDFRAECPAYQTNY